MNVSECLASALSIEGVQFVFNVPDEVTVLVAQDIAERDIRIVRPRHEQSAVAMADGFARASGKIGVCLLGPGPALAQTGTALVTAVRKRSQVLVLLGQSVPNRGGIKQFDGRRFIDATGAAYLEVRSAGTFVSDLHEAFRLVRLRRGPVVLAIGDQNVLETTRTEIDQPYVATAPGYGDGSAPTAHSSSIEQAAAILVSATRPIIVAGRGAAESGARESLVALADLSGALLFTSLQARGLFSEHPSAAGILGGFASDAGASLIARADCVVAVGVALNPYQSLPPDARVIHIDTDAAAIGAFRKPDVGIVGDARYTTESLASCVSSLRQAAARPWAIPGRSGDGAAGRSERSSLALASTSMAPSTGGHDGRLPVRSALRMADQMLPSERTVVTDAGLFLGSAVDEIAVPGPESWIWTMDFGSIGLGLAMALGAALAVPDRQCALVVGDGGLLMSIQEIETAVREEIPLVIFVMNDAAYAAEVDHLRRAGRPIDLAQYGDCDFAAVGNAFGADTATVRSDADAGYVTAKMPRTSLPLLVDFKIDRAYATHRMMDAVSMMRALR